VRALRALAALAVGAALALSGALLQGLFRNALASPGVLGVTSGASLGASLALAAIGGLGPSILAPAGIGPAWVTLGALAGALFVLVPLLVVAGGGGRLSVPALLLAGMALNALCAGLLAALQSLTLSNYEVARALFAWAFGTLDDRSAGQVGLVWGTLVLGLLCVPFLARELDLLAGGEEDAAALGVAVRRVRFGVLLLAALLAAAAVSVAGQILFGCHSPGRDEPGSEQRMECEGHREGPFRAQEKPDARRHDDHHSDPRLGQVDPVRQSPAAFCRRSVGVSHDASDRRNALAPGRASSTRVSASRLRNGSRHTCRARATLNAQIVAPTAT
jgi:hypothetical protein